MAEPALFPLTQLFIKISNSLSEEDVRNLRAILAREGLGKAKVEQATAIEMFNMLEDENKIGKGKLQYLVQVLRSLGKGRLADEAKKLAQEQRKEGRPTQNPKEMDTSTVKSKVPVEAGVSKIPQEVENLDKKLTATEEKGEQVRKDVKEHSLKPQGEEQGMVTKARKVQKDRRDEKKEMEERLQQNGSTHYQIAGNRTLQPSRQSPVSSGFLLASAGFSIIVCLFVCLFFINVEKPAVESLPCFQPSSLSQVSGSSLSVFAGFSIDVQEPAVESLPCSVTVTTNTTDLTGGDVTPQIEVTSPQGKTTLIQTTAHSSPPLSAGKGQTSRVRRVWGGVWRPQESGKHTLGVCMGGKKNLLGSLTVDVGSNNPVLRFGQKESQQGQFDGPVSKYTLKKKAPVKVGVSKITQGVENLTRKLTSTGGKDEQVTKEAKEQSLKPQGEKQKMILKADKVQKDWRDEFLQEKTEIEKRSSLRGSSQTAGNRTLQPSRHSQVSSAFLSDSALFSIDVEEPAVESLPCSVTVTTNTADLTGGDVTPQIEVTSPQGKTTLIQTIAHSSPPLAAGKGQTSRVRRVWGAEWRPQESGKHTLGVCMGGNKDLGSLTVYVGSNNPVLRFGQEGIQQGQFVMPLDVAVRGDKLYVADTWNGRVQVFDLSGKFCHSFPTASPVGLAVQTDGTIVVKSWMEVKRFSSSGKLLNKFPLGEYCTNPYGLAVQRCGRVVVADYGKHSIFLFEADGTLVKQVGGWGQGEGQFNEPIFVCVDKEDNIIVTDRGNDCVQVFDKNLNLKHKFGQRSRQPQDMWAPHGVSADSRGNIVLANRGDASNIGGVEHGKKLQVFHPNGIWVSTINSDGDKLNWPHGVAVTEDGHVFVTDPGEQCIRKYRYM